MASMNRPKIATHVINERVTIDTTDREDHTFCGIAFPIQAKTVLPVDHIVINSIGVRGALGPVTVWVTKHDPDDETRPLSTTTTTSATTTTSSRAAGTAAVSASAASTARTSNRRRGPSVRYNLRSRGGGGGGGRNRGNNGNHQNHNQNHNNNHVDHNNQSLQQGQMILKKEYWEKIYENKHEPSYGTYCTLDISSNPIILSPGQIRGVYIHSTRNDDQAIVYDNQQKLKTYDDKHLTVLPGRSHVSPQPFGTVPIWGHGNAWREQREFVGRISYGIVYKLWNPNMNQLAFGSKFQQLARILFLCQRRVESPLSRMPDDCIYYILNMCRWDWMDDTFDDVRALKKKLRTCSEREAAAAATTSTSTSLAVAVAAADNNDGTSDSEEDEEGPNVAADAEVDAQGEGANEDDDDDDESEVIMEIEYQEAESDDSNDDDDNNDDDDDSSEESVEEWHDHSGSTRFRYFYYDDYGSSGEEEAAEAHRLRQERQHFQFFIRHHHLAQLGVNLDLWADGNDNDDSDDNDDDAYEYGNGGNDAGESSEEDEVGIVE